MKIMPAYRENEAGISSLRRDCDMLDTLYFSTAFLAYAGLIAAIVARMLLRTFRGGGAALALAVLALWLGYAGAFSGFGLLRDPAAYDPARFAAAVRALRPALPSGGAAR